MRGNDYWDWNDEMKSFICVWIIVMNWMMLIGWSNRSIDIDIWDLMIDIIVIDLMRYIVEIMLMRWMI